MKTPRRDLDEDDVRVRARGGSRPRTRRRPQHAEAREAFVLAVDRGRYRCLVDGTEVVAMKARELGRGSIAVGDRVALVGDLSGREGTLARVVRVARRRSALRRTADDTDPSERVIVANAELVVIVASLADPPPQPRLIDRCLVAAHDAGADALLCLTKADLDDPGPVLRPYEALRLDHVVTRVDRQDGFDALAAWLDGRVSVLVGSSGVGKSTLVNRVVARADRAVGEVNPVTGRGRHTSTSVVALPVGDGWVIDTPGVRSFGLAHVSRDRIVEAFPDLAPVIAHCPAGCPHTAEAADCALQRYTESGAPASRVESLHRLLAADGD